MWRFKGLRRPPILSLVFRKSALPLDMFSPSYGQPRDKPDEHRIVGEQEPIFVPEIDAIHSTRILRIVMEFDDVADG